MNSNIIKLSIKCYYSTFDGINIIYGIHNKQALFDVKYFLFFIHGQVRIPFTLVLVQISFNLLTLSTRYNVK